MRIFLSSLFLMLLCGLSLSAYASSPFGVAAVVNDDVISQQDVQDRLKIAIATSGLKSSPQTEKTLLPQIIQLLIDEKLYAQEAKKLGLVVTDEELKSAIRNIENQNALPEGSFNTFIAERHLPKEPFIDQLRSQIAWNKIIMRKLRPYATVTEAEIDEKMENYLSEGAEEELLISEITLPLDDNSNKMEIQNLANDLVKKIRDGADFSAIAQQFSRSSTASNGGEIGWIEASQLAKELTAAIKTLKPGEITDPVITNNGYTILKLQDKRSTQSLQEGDKEESTITLKQILVPLRTEDEAALEKQQALLEDLRGKIENCEDIEAAASTLPTATAPSAITAQIKDFHPEIRNIILNLNVQKPSNVIQTSQGLHVFIVCNRSIPKRAKAALPNREQVHEKLLKKKLMLQARRYLRDLRRNAYIEVRM